MTQPQPENPPPDPYAPVDYPAHFPPLPPPVYPPPYPPPGGYPYPGGYPGYTGDPYDPYRPMKPPGTNGKAIGALVSSLAGLVFCGLPSMRTKRNSASCSQYQSEDSCVRLRQRASLSRRASSAPR